MIQKLGEKTLTAIKHSIETFELFCNSLKNMSALNTLPVRRVLYKQIYFTGIESLRSTATIGIVIGIVIITQVSNIIGLNTILIGKVLVWSVIRELGPLFAAKIIIARSASAIASELGSMKINKEITLLKIMGIDPLEYLIVPRIAGITISIVILTFYFQIFSIIGGLILSSIFIDAPFLPHLKSIFSTLSIYEIGVSVLKSVVFGLTISTISCYHGFRVQSSIREIPIATATAITKSQSLVLILDGIITIALYANI